jgi:hypothetical protein
MKGRPAKLKPYEQIVSESGNANRTDVRRDVIWHPECNKYLDIKPDQIMICGKEVWVTLRESYATRQIYTTRYGSHTLVAYDCWFEYILEFGMNHSDFCHLPEELFEI